MMVPIRSDSLVSSMADWKARLRLGGQRRHLFSRFRKLGAGGDAVAAGLFNLVVAVLNIAVDLFGGRCHLGDGGGNLLDLRVLRRDILAGQRGGAAQVIGHGIERSGGVIHPAEYGADLRLPELDMEIGNAVGGIPREDQAADTVVVLLELYHTYRRAQPQRALLPADESGDARLGKNQKTAG